MSLQIEALSPIMWTIIIAVALVLIAAVVFTWKSSAMSTRKMVTIAMLTAVYVVLNFAGTVRLGWINISVASLPVIVGAMLYGPVGGLLVGLLGQLLTYGVTATTILWILPQAARGLLVGVYAKHCGYKFSSGQLTLALIGTALVVTALNTGAMYIDSVIYNYYSYAYVFGGLVVRIISGAATADGVRGPAGREPAEPLARHGAHGAIKNIQKRGTQLKTASLFFEKDCTPRQRTRHRRARLRSEKSFSDAHAPGRLLLPLCGNSPSVVRKKILISFASADAWAAVSSFAALRMPRTPCG